MSILSHYQFISFKSLILYRWCTFFFLLRIRWCIQLQNNVAKRIVKRQTVIGLYSNPWIVKPWSRHKEGNLKVPEQLWTKIQRFISKVIIQMINVFHSSLILLIFFFLIICQNTILVLLHFRITINLIFTFW